MRMISLIMRMNLNTCHFLIYPLGVNNFQLHFQHQLNFQRQLNFQLQFHFQLYFQLLLHFHLQLNFVLQLPASFSTSNSLTG